MKTKNIYLGIIVALVFSGNLYAQKENLDAINNTNNPNINFYEPQEIVLLYDYNSENTLSINIYNFILTDVDTREISTNSILEVIPIASTNNILINIKNNSEQYFIIELFNKVGTVLYHKTIQSNSIEKKIDLNAFPKGNFTLKVSSEYGNIFKYYTIEQL